MEPISTVCGVLTLVGDVVKTVNNIRALVATYKSAAKETAELVNHLSLLGSLFQLVRDQLQRSHTLPNPAYRASMLEYIANILATCENKLKQVEQDLLGLGKPGRIFGCKYMIKKQDILQAFRDIKEVTDTLRLALDIDSWILAMNSVEQPPGYEAVLKMDRIDREASLTTSTTTEEIGTTSSYVVGFPENSYSVALRKSCQTQRYHGMAGQIQVTRKNRQTKWSYFDNGITDESTEYSIRLPLVPYQIALQLRTSSCMPLSYSLNITHVIRSSTQFGKKLLASFHLFEEEGDLQKLQSLLSSRRISIYSMLHDDALTGSTSSLLQLAINHRMPRISKFLAQNDRSGKCLESLSMRNLAMTYLPARESSEVPSREAEQVLSVLFNSARADLDKDFFQWISYIYPDPEQFGNILNHFLRHHEGDIAEWIDMAWGRAVDNFINLGTTAGGYAPGYFARRVEEWAPIIKQLVELGVDLHGQYQASWGYSRGSAYFHLLNEQDCHKQVIKDVDEWLRMLEDCGVHLPTYLARERKELPEQWEIVHGIRRGTIYTVRDLKTIDHNGLTALVWTPINDASNGALEVFREFEALRGSHISKSFRFSFPQRSTKEGRDKCASNVQPVEQKLALYNTEEWPIQHTLTGVAEEAVCYEKEWPLEYRQRIQRLLENHKRRLERRWKKRAGHRGAGRGVVARMPGGWVESN